MPEIFTVNLNNPAIFHDLNLREGQHEDYTRYELKVRFPQFKDLPRLQQANFQKQVDFCAVELASLSFDDLDELSTTDGKRLIEGGLDIIVKFNLAYETYMKEQRKNKRA